MGGIWAIEASNKVNSIKRYYFGDTMVTLGKLNKVEHKFYLAAVGIFSCLCGSVIGIGFSLLFGFTYTALSGLIPFICLGIGIDDMFVITRKFPCVTSTKKLWVFYPLSDCLHNL